MEYAAVYQIFCFYKKALSLEYLLVTEIMIKLSIFLN